VIAAFRLIVQKEVRFIEITYPTNDILTLADYAKRRGQRNLARKQVGSGWLLGESSARRSSGFFCNNLRPCHRPIEWFQPKG